MEARSRAKQIPSDLGFDYQTFSIGRFLMCAGDCKKRQISTIPWSMSAGMFGAWVTDDKEAREYIFNREDVLELKTCLNRYLHRSHQEAAVTPNHCPGGYAKLHTLLIQN